MSVNTLRLRGGEPLESRRMLDGVVLVDLVNGNLTVQGDELDNVIAIEGRVGRTAAQTILTIIPGPTTSINGMTPGQALRLGPTPLRNVQILPGVGNDRVTVRNLSMAGDFELQDPDGGRFRLASSTGRAGYLKIGEPSGSTSDKGGDRWIDILSVGFREGLRVESTQPLNLTAQNVNAARFITDIKIGDGTGGTTDTVSNVQLSGLKLRGDLLVTSEGGPLVLSARSSSSRAGYLKIGRTDGEAFEKHKHDIDILSSRFRGGLRVESTQPLDLKAHKVNAAAVDLIIAVDDIDGDAIGNGSNVELSALKLTGDLNVTNFGAPLTLKAVSSSSLAGYLKIGRTDGETSDKQHKSWIDIESWSFRGGLRVESTQPLNLTAHKVSAATFVAAIKTDDILSESTDLSSSIRLVGLNLAGRLNVSSTGGPVDLKIIASKFRSSVVSISATP